MGNFNSLEIWYRGWGFIGKVDSPLSENVEWGNFKIKDIFEIQSYKKRFDANKVDILQSGRYPYVVRMGANNGQKGYINEEEKFLNEGNTISFGQDTATMFYQEIPYFTGDKIKILKSKDNCFNKYNAQYFITCMAKAFSSFSWGNNSFSIEIIGNQEILLPTKDHKVDFNFIEKSTAKIEAEHLAKVEKYLIRNSMYDTKLKDDEKRALDTFQDQKLCKFKLKDLFNNIVQGRRLKKEDQISGTLPFVMAGITNTGVVNYIGNDVNFFPRNSITVDIFGNVFYRNFKYGLGDDTGAYWNTDIEQDRKAMLYLSTAMQSFLNGKFDYGNKLRSSKSLNFEIILPVDIDSRPDYKFMESYISAIEKLTLKRLISYLDDKKSRLVK